MRTNVLITGIGSAGGRNAAKSLVQRDDISLFGTDANRYSYPLYNDAFARTATVPRGAETGYTDAIFDFCREHDIDVIFPTFDEAVSALSRERERFTDHGIRPMLSSPSAVEKANKKDITCQIASRNGVPAPDTWDLDAVELDDLVKSLPLIVKPRVGRGAEGVHRCETERELKGAIDTLRANGSRPIAQQVIEGPPENIRLFTALYDRDGNRRTIFCSQTLDTKYKFGGPAIAGKPLVDDQLIDLGKRVFDAIDGWVGPVNAEFKIDERSGDLLFMEINPRYWGYSYLATAAGINFPSLAIDLALDKKVQIPTEYRTDIVTMRTMEDMIVKESQIQQTSEKK